jgi:hypothetical protein
MEVGSLSCVVGHLKIGIIRLSFPNLAQSDQHEIAAQLAMLWNDIGPVRMKRAVMDILRHLECPMFDQ